ncbi:nitrate reductase molybdenum cofactor assembly chaperone [Desulfopila sp. IMCC35006]|uniref:nitrate reductase molybdenum cofactor assembly chaperone n=1 Tax=Desulfopila sp. IMCC35006 TaxID=2569542 RepID=UPI0010ACB28F|nr:nitrate reductase molybdenum cofactor assembly chaperone [Desulfopila sp. IMCC35006]TKB25923.1 nitrate reductase molybdenum cofactor assembly chaperone [Desulfopila sp. IMCC35006]
MKEMKEMVDFMTDNDRVQCKLLALLLDYPAASWETDLVDVRETVDTVDDRQRRDLLQKFLHYAEATPLVKLQETYTAAFDLEPATSLYLTYHLMGDSEDRGKALAALLWLYHREGYDAAIGELPDYLPMILEFLALCPKPEDADLLWSCLGTVTDLAERLAKNSHPYAGLVELAADIVHPRMSTHPDTSKEV